MTAWVKLYTDVLGDPKLMRAARKGAQHLVLLPWLLAFARQANDNGRLTVNGEPADAEDIAPLIPGATAAQVAGCLAELTAIAVLVDEGDGVLRFAAWEKRTSKPSDSADAVADRVRRHRDRKRNARTVTPRNAAQGVTCNALEEEVEEEVDREEEVDPTTTPTAPEAKIAARLPTDDDRHALTGLVGQLSFSDPWLAEMRASLDGMSGHQHLTPAQLGQALRDYVGNGERPNLERFRGYLRRAASPQKPAHARAPPGGRPSSPPSTPPSPYSKHFGG